LLQQGELVGDRFEVGRPGHGEPALSTFIGVDTRTQAPVWLVALHRSVSDDPEAFAQLRRLPARIRPGGHPHVAGVLAVEEHRGYPVVVYERRQGEPLAELLLRPSGDEDLPRVVARHLAEALAHLHLKEDVHGALAPHWVEVYTDDVGPGVLVWGMGLGCAYRRVGQGPHEAVYSAPERRRGASPVPQSDVYSFGAILAHTLTGSPPPASPGWQPATASLTGLSGVIQRCMAPRVEDRPAGGEALLDLVRAQVPPPKTRARSRPVTGLAPPTRSPGARPPKPRQGVWQRVRRLGAGPSRVAVGATAAADLVAPVSVTAGIIGALLLPLIVGLPLLALYVGWQHSTPAEVTVPNVVGKTVEQARRLLLDRELRLAVVDEAYDPDIPAGQIVWCKPPAGRTVKEGRTISVRISRGARQVTVPEVTRLKASEARRRLQEAGLHAAEGRVAYSDIVSEGAVISQSPQAGRKLLEGSEVVLLVSKGPRAGEVTSTAARPRKVDPAIAKLERRTAKVTLDVPQAATAQRVQIRVVDAEGERVVYDGLHEPGDHIEETVAGRGPATVSVILDEQVIHQQSL